MSSSFRGLKYLLGIVFLVFFVGCIILCIGIYNFMSGDLGLTHPPSPFNASIASTRAMELYDTNKDGKISGAELDQAPSLKAALIILGTDKDRGITSKQIADRIQKWVDSKIGRMFLSCTITHNGKLLEGAVVKFIPEQFLADNLTENAIGTTDQSGVALVSLPTLPGPDEPPPGIPPGLYRVEITKDGEDIPAKYNTATELGQEISIDNIDVKKGVKFDLKY
jgi:hypothetical protein